MIARSPRVTWRSTPRRSVLERGLGQVVALLLALTPASGLVHGGALELSLSPDDIAASDAVTVSGEGFAANAALELHLTGPNGDAHLGGVTADEDGEFTQEVRIPGEVVPGLYLIRATGGGKEASAELTVGAMAGMGDPMREGLPERERSGAWQAVAVALFLGVAALGLALPQGMRRGSIVRSS
jgi:hypothetical protein